LARYLSTKGWQHPPPLSLKNFLGMLSPDTPIEKLPVLPRLDSGRVDCLHLVRRDNDKLWVLRLWPSDFGIAGKNTPILVGTIEVQHRRHLTWLITAAVGSGEYDHPQDAIIQMLQNRFAFKAVSRSADEIQANSEQRRSRWRGRVLLVWEST